MQAPTCWALPEIRSLLQWPQVRQLYIDQCSFGQCARKPTTLLACHLDELTHALERRPDRGLCVHRHHRARLGTDAQGRFHTSVLKEYPRELCATLATAVLRRWSHKLPVAAQPLEDDPLRAFYAPLDPYVETTMGADFAWHSAERARLACRR